MNNIDIVLVALYRYRNIPIRIMHPMLEDIPGVKPHSIFFKNCETNIFDSSTPKEEGLFIDIIRGIKPRLLGFSVLSPYEPIARRLSMLVRAHSPSTLIIWGGIHPTISPESCINKADIVCVGEGEGAIKELVEHIRDDKPYHSIRNLWVKKRGKVIKNSLRPLIQDLDSLPFPAYGKDSYYFINDSKATKKDMTIFDNVFWVQTSRGCPFICSYCINSILRPMFKELGSYTRRRSVTNVVKEIKMNNRTDMIVFLDEVFGVDKVWIDEFERQYKKEVGLPFCVEYNPKLVDSVLLNKLAASGLDMLNFGIQTGSDYIRNHIFNRPGTNRDILNLAKEIAKCKIRIKYDLIIDNPYDNEETLKETINLLLQLPKPLFFNLYSLQYFPGLPITNRAIKDGHIMTGDTTVDKLMERTTRNWVFVPRLFPFSERQMLQNIIWLITMNHASGSIVRHAVSGKNFSAKLCRTYLHIKSFIFGKILGVGGIMWRHYWIAYIINGVKYIAKGDFKTAYSKLKKRLPHLMGKTNFKSNQVARNDK